ncbi:MAG: hypothetical protein CL858_29130 [Cupriavidus sp.]|jgi:hypothetical protein|uniref:hypothetical protein n=1 Tax=Methylobacterium sp. TaxID=409 RepID=UPI000C413643|nr:hypothetical protein [Methylobacterium sp.]MBP32443.1 hypothetical protein [Methylobacterium sp.]MBU69445.1 hypothetical protein [Cupriavidus sp.]
MSTTQDAYDDHEKAWPFEEVLKAGREGARAQQRRFQEYVAENDPALAAALATEAARFEIVSRTVIEPAMLASASAATQRGWHVSVVRDDDLDRLALFATPGIRFYCSRRPSRTVAGGVIWPPCFVGFYGSARSLAVATHVELSQLDGDAVPTYQPLLNYPDVTSETVRAVLAAFFNDLKRIG